MTLRCKHVRMNLNGLGSRPCGGPYVCYNHNVALKTARKVVAYCAAITGTGLRKAQLMMRMPATDVTQHERSVQERADLLKVVDVLMKRHRRSATILSRADEKLHNRVSTS